MKTYRSSSSEETKKFGEKLAREILRARTGASSRVGTRASRNGALVLALRGDLGAGKTTFVQGFFYGLGLKKRAPSPTFVIMRRHAIRSKKFANVFHLDLYRLKKASDLRVLGFKEILADPRNIILIEWAERARRVLPKTTIWLRFGHGKKENERHIMIKR